MGVERGLSSCGARVLAVWFEGWRYDRQTLSIEQRMTRPPLADHKLLYVCPIIVRSRWEEADQTVNNLWWDTKGFDPDG